MNSTPIGESKCERKSKEHVDQYLSIKLILALFLIFLFVSSDVFIFNVLSKFDGTVKGRDISAYGTCVQGIMVVIMFAIVDFLISGGFL